MSQFDESRLPTGDIGWAALIEHALSLGDLAEVDFLELKGHLPFTGSDKKRSFAMLAREILAFANRMPDEGSGRLGGHAVILVGIDKSGLVGAEEVDGTVLRDNIEPYLTAEGPGWDYRYVLHKTVRVLAITVEPPNWGVDAYLCGRQYTVGSRSDGQKENLVLNDGDIFIRAKGGVRRATRADQLRLRQRALRKLGPVDFAPWLTEGFDQVHVDSVQVLYHSWISKRVADLRGSLPAPPPPGDTPARLGGVFKSPQLGYPAAGSFLSGLGANSLIGSPDTRSASEFLSQLESWRHGCLDIEERVVEEFLIHNLANQRLRVANPTDKHLDRVQVTLTFPEGVFVLLQDDAEYCDHGGPFNFGQLAPDLPDRWGSWPVTSWSSPMHRLNVPIRGDIIKESRPEGTMVRWDLDDLRSRGTAESVSTLAVVVNAHNPSLRVQWAVTAAGVDERFVGEVEILPRGPAGQCLVWTPTDGDPTAD